MNFYHSAYSLDVQEWTKNTKKWPIIFRMQRYMGKIILNEWCVCVSCAVLWIKQISSIKMEKIPTIWISRFLGTHTNSNRLIHKINTFDKMTESVIDFVCFSCRKPIPLGFVQNFEENHEIYSLNKPFDFSNLSRLTTNTLGKNKRNSGNTTCNN